MTLGIIVLARLRSSRLPAKALLPFFGMSMLGMLLRRLKSGGGNLPVVLATTELREDDFLVEVAESEGCEVFRGENEDVAGRFVRAAAAFGFDYAVRVTGDCPLIDGQMVDHCLEQCMGGAPFDHASTKGYFPVGLDLEVVNVGTLQALVDSNKLSADDKEHVTLYMVNNPNQFRMCTIMPPGHWPQSEKTYTVDTFDDYVECKRLVESIGSDTGFSVSSMLESERR